jgi:hypothetical protein
LPRRWVVERTIAWIGRYRRLSKDYEYLPESSETMIYLLKSDRYSGLIMQPCAPEALFAGVARQNVRSELGRAAT